MDSSRLPLTSLWRRFDHGMLECPTSGGSWCLASTRYLDLVDSHISGNVMLAETVAGCAQIRKTLDARSLPLLAAYDERTSCTARPEIRDG